jgi:hypothetical protein
MPLLSIYHKTEYRYLHPVAFGVVSDEVVA